MSNQDEMKPEHKAAFERILARGTSPYDKDIKPLMCTLWDLESELEVSDDPACVRSRRKAVRAELRVLHARRLAYLTAKREREEPEGEL